MSSSSSVDIFSVDILDKQIGDGGTKGANAVPVNNRRCHTDHAGKLIT